jgi:kexin
MHVVWTLTAATALISSVTAKPARREYASHAYYVLEHEPQSGLSVEESARALGVEVVDRAGELQDHWLVRTPHTAKRDVDTVLTTYETARRRAADPSSSTSWLTITRRAHKHEAKRLVSSVKYLERQEPRQRIKRVVPDDGLSAGSSAHADRDHTVKNHDVAISMKIRDPEFSKQWHLVNDEYPQNSMNVSGVWEMGITGKGVISALVDDGLDFTSDDLASNFVSTI